MRLVRARLGHLAQHLLVEAARRLLGHQVVEGVRDSNGAIPRRLGYFTTCSLAAIAVVFAYLS